MAHNPCSLCTQTVNYAKLVDAPAKQYGTILGDSPQEGDSKRGGRGSCPPVKCIPVFPIGSDQVSSCPIVCQPCPPSPPTKIWLLKSSPAPPKSFCFPIGGEESSSSGNSKPFVFCFPPQPIVEPPKPKEELKPIGYISRNKDVDFIGGKLIAGCTCGKKNGLAGTCPRISCRNNPGCTMNPPRCWPAIKLPDPPPPPPPDQKMICVPIQLVYMDKPQADN